MLLEVRDLQLYYKTLRGIVKAVDHVDFEVPKGEAVGLVGESGCGKTSMALAISRLLPKNVETYRGSVLLEGTDLLRLLDAEFQQKVRWRRVAMVFQGAMNSLNPVIRVGHQVAEPLRLHAQMENKAARERVVETFQRIGLPEAVYNRYPHELSGGMKQRVVIAMALIMNPDLVILDEPTSALDVSVQAQIMNLLKRLKREMGISMIFITHDIALASDVCDRMAVMYGGEIVELGNAEQILLTPKHPYTQLLLASIPRLRGDERPAFIPGAPPDLLSPPSGCRFHPRCPYIFEPCRGEHPILFKVGEGHTARCFLHREEK